MTTLRCIALGTWTLVAVCNPFTVAIPHASAQTRIFLSEAGFSEPVGNWDPVTRVATLTQDLDRTLEITTGNLYFDGNGFQIATFGYDTYDYSPLIMNGVADVRMSNVDLYSEWGDAIVATGCTNLWITDSTLNAPTADSRFAAADGLYLARNHFNGTVALRVNGGTNIVIEANQIVGATLTLDLQSLQTSVVRDNVIEEGMDFPVRISGGSLEFYRNQVLDDFNPVLVQSPGHVFYNNDFHGPVQTVAGCTFFLPVPVGGNRWADYTGSDTDGDGFGEDPYVFPNGVDQLPLAAYVPQPDLGGGGNGGSGDPGPGNPDSVDYDAATDSLTLTTEITNNGTEIAENFRVAFYLVPAGSGGGPLDASSIEIGSLVIQSLAAGGVSFLTFGTSMNAVPDGEYEVFSVIDPDGQVAESDEADNYHRFPQTLVLNRVISVEPTTWGQVKSEYSRRGEN